MNAQYTSLERRRHLLLAVALLAGLFLITLALPPSEVVHLDGTREVFERKAAVANMLRATLISIPVLSLLLAFGVAALPYKNLPYRQKYGRAWLMTLLTIYGIMTALGTLKLIRIWLGL